MPEIFSTLVEFAPFIGGFSGLLYLLIVFWVAKDIAHRSTHILMQSFSIIITIALPFVGLMIYLLIRPELLIHREIREFLYAQNNSSSDAL